MPALTNTDRRIVQRSASDPTRPKGGWLFAILAALIAYGSLYPFGFAMPATPAAAWAAFLADLRLPVSRGDVLGNVALFVPLGAIGVMALPARTLLGRAGATLALSLSLAIALQAAQIYLPSRTPALGDAAWNVIGTAAGVALGAGVASRVTRLPAAAFPLPAAIVLVWLAAELVPFVPSLDWQGFKDSVKPLLRGEFALAPAALHAAGVLLAGEAIARTTDSRRAAAFVALAAGAVLLAKTLVVTQRLDLSVLAGFALGLAAWLAIRMLPATRRGAFVAVALASAYVIAALAPFELAASPNRFAWMPFAGLLSGSMLANTQALLTATLVFAGLSWIAREARGSARAAGIGVAGLALLLELAQIYIHGRSPGITEPILALVIGYAVGAWPAAVPASERRPVPAPAAVDARGSPERRASPGWLAWASKLAIACVAIAIPIAVVLRLPGIPYNVAELFRAGGAFPVLLVFALALLWTGAAPVLISEWMNAAPRRDWHLPPLAFAAGLASLALLWLSVTAESVADIAGSSNLYWFVTNKDIWGSWARHAFLALDAPGIIGFLERCVRYAALYGPVATFPAFLFLVLDAARKDLLSGRRIAKWLVSGGLWLWLCKGIAFDWSSTDNLNELIARDAFFGLGGGGYLYLLVVVFAANVVWLASMPLRPAAALAGVVATLVALPCGWWLLTHGLEPRVEKYGNVFSGAQFLLGPDRARLLGEDVLFLRWAVVQLGAVIVATAGARIARAMPIARGS